MWNSDNSYFHLKYMVNNKFKQISYLVFNLETSANEPLKMSSEVLKSLQTSNLYMKVDKQATSLKLWIANLKTP